MAARAPRRTRPRGGPRWLQALVEELRCASAPARSASAIGGVLKVELSGPAELTVEVKPIEPGREYFCQTARFGVSYCGSRNLTPPQEAALGRFTEVLRRVEAELPEVLEAAVGVGAPGERAAGDAPAHTVEYSQSASGDERSCELLLRLTSRCNQDCPFCSAPPPHAEPTLMAALTFLDGVLPRLPRPMVTLTGGEPTIWPHLRELVERLLGRPDTPRVRVQTNAVAFADPGALDGWPRSDRLSFFVSFHAAEARLYDHITGSTGHLERAVAGTRNLAQTGCPVVLNLVATRFNLDHVLDWVRAVPELFPAPGTPTIHFSIAMCPEHRPGALDCLVRYTDLAPRLQAAAALAARLGVDCEPLLASSHAAIPPCLLDEEYRVRGGSCGAGRGALPVQRRDEVGIEDLRKPWIKARTCARCTEDPFCLGLPRPYVARFGLGELRPIERT
ncbi:MAG: radical SAM protein [Deltaproteobacteria bacterium]|nr:radical SAM protein [Deltaproteobacteria bacterium]